MGAGPDALSQIIARAYEAFAVPAPPNLGVCTACCMDPAMEQAMLARHPRDLTLDEVQEWLGAAFSRDGGRHAVSWIMPRILELIAKGHDVAVFGNEVALYRLRLTGFPDHWPEEQAIVVGSVCMIALDQHIAARRPELDSLLCMIANGGLAITPYLARLDTQPDAVLADLLFADWTSPGRLSIWRTAFWDGVPERDVVWNWYTSAQLEARMWHAGAAGNKQALEVAEAIARSPAAEPRR